MRHLAACAALALALASCSAPVPTPPPQASEQCIPLAMLQAIAKAKHLEMAEVKPTAPFLAALNKLPPPSDYTADNIYVLHLSDSARLILADGGCARNMVDIPWGEFIDLAGQGT